MARLTLTSGYSLMDEGTQIVRIYGVEYKEAFGNLTVYLINAQGQTMRETFRFKTAKGEPNEGALNAFSYFAKCAMNDFDIVDIDPTELVNHYIQVEIVHNKSDNTGRTYANLGRDKAAADGFDTTPTPEALTKLLVPAASDPKPEESNASNIDDLLGGI